MNENEGSKKKSKEWLYLLIYLAIVIMAALLLNRYVIQKVEVDGPSMEETLHTSDQLFVEKLSYRLRNPKIYDIIVFHPYSENPETYYIKRIVGVPGDYIQIKEGKVYRNRKALDDPQGEEYLYDAGMAEDEILIGDDEYFVLGDNRYQSIDSRSSTVGLVKREDIVGRAFFRLWPFNRIGMVK